MSLKIYNSLTRRKEPFQPFQTGKVRMYVCGITAYDECHLGHARAAVVFDIVYRTLIALGHEVLFVRNFTDIDDKIIKRAAETGTGWEALAQKYIQSYGASMDRLKVLRPSAEPCATQHLTEMIELVKTLEKKGLAYPSGGDVYFAVRKFAGYGRLSHKKIDELEAGARVEVGEKKEDPLDFALWKGAKPGEPKWPSPWGEGRPGWHLECSAMSMKYLGPTFDIHGGGRDLIFPHHENEIAQSEAATGRPFAKYWIHNGFVNINAEKMSKSLGNIRTIGAILNRWAPETVRFFLISSHYRSPIDFSEEKMEELDESLARYYETLRRLKNLPEGKEKFLEMEIVPTLMKFLEDDFNTAGFIGFLFDAVRQLNAWIDRYGAVDSLARDHLFGDLKQVDRLLGVFGQDPVSFLDQKKSRHLEAKALASEEIVKQINERNAARSQKDWRRADEIRVSLSRQGIELRDNPDGTTSWEVRRSS